MKIALHFFFMENFPYFLLHFLQKWLHVMSRYTIIINISKMLVSVSLFDGLLWSTCNRMQLIFIKLINKDIFFFIFNVEL